MKVSYKVVLKEITDELALAMVSGSAGSRGWYTGAHIIWSTVVGALTSKNCSWPGGFYGPGNPTPTGSGVCVGGGWNIKEGRYCNFDPFNDNDVCY
ncbi:hypothetical protein J0B02_13965 [Enterobacteriaceae bacterium YMB-R22]|jgi:hypothetical protein|uniref:hypothetical protein n=1 Tax=Tenebrionicola larvae TaxID=2815733 RepID=UPI00201183BF|nr:hypothetical protein [Tenebrionicola larvae]MBV4413905.1 hypothetical protein [Tenebrionicola larvae]